MSQAQSPTWPSLYNPAVDLFGAAHEPAVQSGGKYLYNADDIFRFTFYWTLIFYLPIFVICGIAAFINIAFAPNPQQNAYKTRPHPQTQTTSLFKKPRSRPRFLFFMKNISRQPKVSDTTAETEEHPLTLTTYSSVATPTSTTPFAPNLFSITEGENTTPQGFISPASPSFQFGAALPSASSLTSSRRLPPKPNVHRTRAVYALLVLLFFFASGLLGAVIGSAVVGYLLAALYKAGNFNMSTWIPAIFALVQTLVAFLGIYPSIVEII